MMLPHQLWCHSYSFVTCRAFDAYEISIPILHQLRHRAFRSSTPFVRQSGKKPHLLWYQIAERLPPGREGATRPSGQAASAFVLSPRSIASGRRSNPKALTNTNEQWS